MENMEDINIILSMGTIAITSLLFLIETKTKNSFKEIDIDCFVNKHHKKILLVLFILVIISRFYEFGKLPLAIGIDEAAAAYDSYCLANYGIDRALNSFPIYLVNFGGGQSVLYTYLNVLLIKLTGMDNILISRLPALIFFTVSIIIGYKLVKKKENKKNALLFALLITVSQWQIIQSRFGLDCNLLGPLFILDLYLLENAKKNYHYIFAGISIGVTLYTYSVSWIIIPLFLVVWGAYNLYVKEVEIKQLIIMGSVILLFAIPLLYFILVNKGYVSKTQFGIFTIPKMPQWRGGEIGISNIFNHGMKSIGKIFGSPYTMYYFEIIFFIIGIIIGIKKTVESIRKKEYSFTAIMTLSFIILFISNLLVDIQANNRANILYLLILYFATIGIIETIKNKRIMWIILLISYIALFIIFEIFYYTDYSLKEESKFSDISSSQIVEYMNNNNIDAEEVFIYNNTDENKAAVINYNNYIYYAYLKRISPYIFNETLETENVVFRANNKVYINETAKVDKYYFNYIESDIVYKEDRIYIVDEYFDGIVKKLKNTEYEDEKIGDYYLFYRK